VTRVRLRISEHVRAAVLGCFLLALCLLVSCGDGGGSSGGGNPNEPDTEGPAFSRPELLISSYDAEKASTNDMAFIDTSSVAEGYVAASATADSRLKLMVEIAGSTEFYSYDMPQDGTPIVAPLNMGNGEYTFAVMQQSRGDSYAEVYAVSAEVELEDEFEPYIRPSFFCDYTANSQVVQKANELTADAGNEGDALKSIYSWIVENVTYDEAKAVSIQPGYVPVPDETLQSQTGICFDYASLAAAMLRSQGIPCKIITGLVSSDNIYHAWNMVYINGSWVTVEISVNPNTWTRIDTTFAAGGATEFVGDGSAYTEQLTY